MEANSEGENPNSKSGNKATGNSGEGTRKAKRQMKTRFQLQTLEKAYALETYPTESTRMELSEKLGLSDRQLQMWFCHRRLKHRKETPVKKSLKETPLHKSPADDSPVVEAEPGSGYVSGSGSGSSPLTEPRKVLDDVPMRRYHESSPQSILELRAIACVETQLGEPLREDGPILGIEFDPLPPGAFGAPIAPITDQRKQLTYSYVAKDYERQYAKPIKASKRALPEYRFLQDLPNIRSDAYGRVSQSPHQDLQVDTLRERTSPFVDGDEHLPRVNGAQSQKSRVRHLPQQEMGNFFSLHRDESSFLQREPLMGSIISAHAHSPFQNDMELQLERKRNSDEARVAREVEADENKIHKELEKQDVLRRKNKERMKKEMERLDLERCKEEERLLHERQREEERMQREQRREFERREKSLQRECLRAEKRRQKEELRKEREAEKCKAAFEKAAARKIAKESLDLIEDEQLELMELAAASKGLFSIAHLDYESLQNLESFKESLSPFPPESVELKKPFAIQPWLDSEENIGNLLMVWKFLIAFADVLGLWPFTLEEFVQSFHDYESRLLGEIHIALLRLVIKDIEDVARTPTGGLGTNQYTVVNPEGGHPKIVEGAYIWGFDIRNWQRCLNQLTWPEIFRQMALAGGYGPQLRKRSATWMYLGDDGDGKGCEDTISILRNGSAAESAFALMKEKGLLVPRRSRHRLTPGTVKFAAFHVLSLEGNKGLTVLELADKIQKSGLRDLTTSKTPEASISVALTRDQKLFKRIAPSTYCVRAAFRKDPADAESILSAARRKIRMFVNGFTAEDADDAERDEDSEDDVEEDPEIDDLAAPLAANKSTDQSNEMTVFTGSRDENGLIMNTEPGKGLLNSSKLVKDASILGSNRNLNNEDVRVSGIDLHDMEIDENKKGESWVQGLAEAEYSHLSVEERLNALVALVGVANQGNTIRVVLAERLEDANALKKQMWVEAQLDGCRLKEDITSRLDFTASSKAGLQVANPVVEGKQSTSPLVDANNKEASPSTSEKKKSLLSVHDMQNQLEGLRAEKTLVVQDASTNPDYYLARQNGLASKRLRSQLRAYIGHTAEETYVYRSLPLGQDRKRNLYWQFIASVSKSDPCSGLVFVELHNGNWRVIDSAVAFDALISCLDSRGIRESHLLIMLRKIEKSFKEYLKRNLDLEGSGCDNGNEVAKADNSSNHSACTDSQSCIVCGPSSDALDSSSWFRFQPGKNEMDRIAALKRYWDLHRWVWKECFSSSALSAAKYGKKRCLELLATCDSCLDSYFHEDSHCHSCHQTFSTSYEKSSFSVHAIQCEAKRKSGLGTINVFDSLPLGFKLLKALLVFIEISVPSDVLESFWTENFRKTWGMKLKMSSTTEEIKQLLAVFESAIRRDRFSSSFETTRELSSAPTFTGSGAYDFALSESVLAFPWIPKTTAAVALRLFELEASVIYIRNEKIEPCDEKPLKVYMKLPSRFSSVVNKETELKIEQQDDCVEEKLSDMRSRRNNHKRGRSSGDRSCGTKSKRRAPGPKSDKSKRNAREVVNLGQQLRQQGKRTSGRSSGRGRRTVRRRRVEKMAGESALLGRMTGMPGSKAYGRLPRNVEEVEWSDRKIEMDMEGADESTGGEAANSDEKIDANEYEQQDWDRNYNTPNGWNGNPRIVGDEDGGVNSGDEDASMDVNGIEYMRNGASDGNGGMSDGSDEKGSDLGGSGKYSG